MKARLDEKPVTVGIDVGRTCRILRAMIAETLADAVRYSQAGQVPTGAASWEAWNEFLEERLALLEFCLCHAVTHGRPPVAIGANAAVSDVLGLEVSRDRAERILKTLISETVRRRPPDRRERVAVLRVYLEHVRGMDWRAPVAVGPKVSP